MKVELCTVDANLESIREACIDHIQEAGNPYFEHVFGAPDLAREALSRWMLRESSEIFAGRIRFFSFEGHRVGGMIVLNGDELAVCRKADGFALATSGKSALRRQIRERLGSVKDLFPSVPDEAIYLSKIWLFPEKRGRGLGSQIVEAFKQHARELGATRLELDVAVSNTSAIALYERANFAVVSQREADAGLSYMHLAANV
jgi:ribosomal protein S18 acetylase RimI-like enzyme